MFVDINVRQHSMLNADRRRGWQCLVNANGVGEHVVIITQNIPEYGFTRECSRFK